MSLRSNRLRAATTLTAAAASVLIQVVAAPDSGGRATAARTAGPTVTRAAYQGESPALSGLPAVRSAVGGAGAHPAMRPAGSSVAPARRASDTVVQEAAGTANALTTGTSFEGVSHDAIGVTEPCGTPPDPNSDVSGSYIVEIVNCGYAVFDKSGTTLVGPLQTNQIFTGMGGPCAVADDGDGVVRYDRLAHRWLVSQFALANDDGLIDPHTGQVYTQNFQCVAISKASDPTGAYWLYAFGYDGFNDYPKFGVWPDAYYVTYNMFSSGEGSFTGVKTCALDRASMLTGAPATQQCFDPNGFSILPANDDGRTAPPAGAPNYQLALANAGGSSFLDAWAFHVDWANPGHSTYTQLSSIAVSPYVGACATSYTCIPQAPGAFFTTSTLDSLGDRLMYPLQYRNFGDHQSLVVSHSVKVDNAGAAERWYELRVGAGTTTSNTLSLFQEGTYAPGDGLYRFMGSIAQDGAGDMALGYSDSGSSVHPGIRLTGRLADDPAGTMTETEHTILTGTGSEAYDPAVTSPAVGRWGDYTSMDVDPGDDCTFWYTNEFYNAQTDGSDTHFYRRWHTQIASFRFPQCTDSVDTTKPTAAVTAPTAPFVVAGSARVAWTGTDHGGSGIAHFEIQRRVAAYDGGFGAWAAYATKSGGTLSMTATGLSRGKTYCFRVRATDRAANVGNWSSARCTAVPLDDRALQARSGWVRVSGSSYWNHTSTNTETQHKALTRTGARLDRIGLVATRCGTCGVVGIYVGTHLVGKIDTSGPAQYRKLYVLPRFSYRTGTVKITVLSSGRHVKIDGLGITRA